MFILIHNLTVLRSNTHLNFIITYDRRWMRERLVRQTQHSIRIDGFWHRRWDKLLPRHRWWFFFFRIVHFPCRHYLSNSESLRHASRVRLNSVASSDFKFFLRQRGAFLCRTIHWRVEDHVDIPKILPEFGKNWPENLNLNKKLCD